MTPLQVLAAGVAGFAAGGVNALAGGGTLISFPILVAIGIPAISANVTNTVALSPGYLGGALAQRGGLDGQHHRVRSLGVVAAIGGLAGSILLVLTSDEAFESLIPVLLLTATVLLAVQDRIRTALGISSGTDAVGADVADGVDGIAPHARDAAWLPLPVLAVAAYGGFFGAGLGIMLLAVLGIVLDERLDRLNALKQVLSLIINVTAALFFLTSGRVYWVAAAVMAASSLAGGAAGGRLAGRVRPDVLRAIVILIGLSVSIVYAVKNWT